MNTPWKGPTMVELVDGRMVLSDAEEWRHETEARDLLNLPFDERIAQIEANRVKRPDDTERLLATMERMREKLRAAPTSEGFAHG